MRETLCGRKADIVVRRGLREFGPNGQLKNMSCFFFCMIRIDGEGVGW